MKQGIHNYFSKSFWALLKIKKTIAFSSSLGAVLEQALTSPPAGREQSRVSLHHPVPQPLRWENGGRLLCMDGG